MTIIWFKQKVYEETHTCVSLYKFKRTFMIVISQLSTYTLPEGPEHQIRDHVCTNAVKDSI